MICDTAFYFNRRMENQTGRTAINFPRESERRIDLLGFMVRYLHFTFLGPSQETKDTTWKKVLYYLVQFVMLFLYIPIFLGIALGLYKFRENIADMTDILVTGVSFMTAFPSALYFVKNWDEIRKFMVLMETKSCFTNPFVYSNSNLLSIIEETKRKCTLLTKAFVITEFIGICTFLCKPFILNYLEDPNINLTDEEYIMKQWKKMIYVIWFPVDLRESVIFYSIYTFQALAAMTFFCHTSSVMSFNLVMIRYSAMQFTLTIEALSEIDNVTNSPTLESKTYSENRNISSSDMTVESFLRDLSPSHIPEHTLEQADSNEVFNYFRECILLHQIAISFAKQMNKLLSPLFVIYLLLPSISLVVSTFQLAMGGGLEKNAPYLSVSSIVLLYTFALCSLGQTLIDESLAVDEAVYNVNWYTHPRCVKDLINFIIMRSQNAVEIKESGFPNVSIATFSMIVNASYQWFTVLLNMLHE
ncbi:Odorant receptor 24 [Blattella germanica]|nr:Odorant receptor 24 [Blattella germanica]